MLLKRGWFRWTNGIKGYVLGGKRGRARGPRGSKGTSWGPKVSMGTLKESLGDVQGVPGDQGGHQGVQRGQRVSHPGPRGSKGVSGGPKGSIPGGRGWPRGLIGAYGGSQGVIGESKYLLLDLFLNCTI